MKSWQTKSMSAEATESLAAIIGKNLHGGEVIELASDLGGGKTTFVRGLARGMGSMDKVASPTFTVSKVYTAQNLELHHFDFYRLPEAGLLTHELQEILDEKNIVVVVEWAEIIRDVLPAQHLIIEFKRVAENEDTREIVISYPENLEYVLKGIL